MNTHSSNTGTRNADRERLLSDLPVTERRLHPAGVSTAVLEGGNGPPVVLLHGPGESSIWWMRVIPDLVRTNRVIVPDLPGHGASGMFEGELDTGHVLRWLDELIELTCPSPPALAGHLLGGAIAARYAARYRRRISRLVLVDSLGLGPFRPAPGFAFGLIGFLMRPNERTYGRFLPQCMFDTERLHSRMGEHWNPFIAYNLDRARDPDTKAALNRFMRQFGIPRIPDEELAGIEVPTHLIWGRHDRATRIRIAEAAGRRYGWPLQVIEEARDDPKLEQPGAFLDALRAAIREDGATDIPA